MQSGCEASTNLRVGEREAKRRRLPLVDLELRVGVGFPRAMPRNKQVDQWFSRYDNPMKPVVQRIREIMLGADKRIDECIKWQAPTFTYQGNIASFFPKSKQHASLMFHLGARIPGNHRRLVGTGDTSRVLKLGTLAEANAAKGDIQRIVKAWCAWRDEGAKPAKGGAKKAAKKATKSAKKTAKKRAAKKVSKKAPAKKRAPKKVAKPASKKRATKKTGAKKTPRRRIVRKKG